MRLFDLRMKYRSLSLSDCYRTKQELPVFLSVIPEILSGARMQQSLCPVFLCLVTSQAKTTQLSKYLKCLSLRYNPTHYYISNDAAHSQIRLLLD
jgi:hypothetical protein